jgi:hypothetical protein
MGDAVTKNCEWHCGARVACGFINPDALVNCDVGLVDAVIHHYRDGSVPSYWCLQVMLDAA